MRFAASLLYAAAVAVLSAVALAFLRGGLDATGVWIAFALGAIVGFAALRTAPSDQTAKEAPGPWEWVAIVVFALASARAFLWLVFTDGNDVKVLSPNNLGDLSLHLTYIHYLARGVPFWPDNPIFADGKLTYPLGVDLLNAMLTVVGVDPLRGLIWVGSLGATLTGMALWRWGRGVALIALLGNGGLAGFAIFVGAEVVDFQTELAWKNFFLALFVTQRGLLFALPAGLLLLASWRARYFSAGSPPLLPRWGELLLYASVPIFHLHTFIFFSLLLGSWWLLHAPARGGLFRFVALALLPATLLVLLVTDFLHGPSVLGWKPGWMWDDATWLKWCEEHLPFSSAIAAPLLFWPMNFGFLLPLVAWLGVRLWRSRADLAGRALFFPALGIFGLCVIVKFAPWEWDNTKIMIWSYLVIVPLAWDRLLASQPLWQRAFAAVLLFGSGLLSLAGGLDGTHKGFDLAERRTLDFVARATAEIPVSERFVGYPTFNHSLLLTGRKMALGYTGHAWSHGLDWQRTALLVDAVMNGDPNWRAAAQELRVRYVFWGAEEREHYADSAQPWKESARLTASGEWGELYDLQTPPE